MKEAQKKRIIFVIAAVLAFGFFANASAETERFDPCQEKIGISCEDAKNNLKLENILQKVAFSQSKESNLLKSSVVSKTTSEFSAAESDDGIEYETIDGIPYMFITKSQEWTTNKSFSEMLIVINPGVELKIKEGGMLYFDNVYLIVGGKFLVEGTKEKPVVIDSGGEFSIMAGMSGEATGNEEIEIHYAEIRSGGFILDGQPFGVISAVNTKLILDNCNIHDNQVGILVANENSEEIKVNHTKFFNNSIYDVVDYSMMFSSSSNFINFQYNWWGNGNGPEKDESVENLDCDQYLEAGDNETYELCKKYEKVYGYKKLFGWVDFSNWFSSEDFRDPVIIIPGITGSWEIEGEWKLDPILFTYNNLISSFEENGYEKDKNLFEFPYEWRNSNTITAETLKNKIDEIKERTGIPRVNIVAHSMGGLVARYYIEGENYQNDVNHLITLGTPHKGSPKSYLTWEAGEIGNAIEDNIIESYFKQESLHAKYVSLKKYIQERVLSVQDLLPDYSYLQELNDESRMYPENYPRNNFLEYLNAANNLKKLEEINLTNIVGNLGKENTITGFRVTGSNEDELWDHGIPENYYDSTTNQGIKYGQGDKTVPLQSAGSITIGEKQEVDCEHNNLPTKAQCNVIRKISGLEGCEYVSTFDRIVDILFFGIFSPVDIQIIDPDGLRVGKDFTTAEILNEIDGAYYSGFNTENEFLTIPNPKNGEYKILTQGTGEGEYKIEATRITENETTAEVREISAEITGTASLDKQEEIKTEVTENEIVVESKDEIAPSITINFPAENESYLNNQVLTIDFSLEDNKTAAEKIVSEMYLDGSALTDKNIDLTLQNLGEHILKITATDEAGNLAEKELKFNLVTDISAIKDNVETYADRKLIKDRRDEHIILSELRLVEMLQKFIAEMEKQRFPNNKNKEKIIRILKMQVNNQLSWLQHYVQKKSDSKPKFKQDSIDKRAAELLIEDFNFVKYK